MARHTTGAVASTRVSVPLRRQDGTPIPLPRGGDSGPPVHDAGYWSPLIATDVGVPGRLGEELVLSGGDVIMVWSPT